MFDDLLAANERYAAGFALGDLTAPAAERLGLVTCMDSRIDPLGVLGLRPGDAKVIRNAGGRVTDDALRSLALATSLLAVDRIAVMHHTGCAMVTEGARLAAAVARETGADTTGWDPLAMPDADAALAADVEAVRRSPLVRPGTVVAGWRYDVTTGRIAEVVPAAPAG
jgi:carbonic anhydrase